MDDFCDQFCDQFNLLPWQKVVLERIISAEKNGIKFTPYPGMTHGKNYVLRQIALARTEFEKYFEEQKE